MTSNIIKYILPQPTITQTAYDNTSHYNISAPIDLSKVSFTPATTCLSTNPVRVPIGISATELLDNQINLLSANIYNLDTSVKETLNMGITFDDIVSKIKESNNIICGDKTFNASKLSDVNVKSCNFVVVDNADETVACSINNTQSLIDKIDQVPSFANLYLFIFISIIVILLVIFIFYSFIKNKK